MIKYAVIISLLMNQFLFAQLGSEFIPDDLYTLSRYRMSVGYVNLLLDDSNYEFRHLFFNWSFRSSGFDKASSSFAVNFAFEPGVNGLIVSDFLDNNKNEFGFYFVPYAKFGPEFRFGKNIFMAASLGLIFAFYESFFAPLPFLGLNYFYLHPLNDNLNVEIEGGFHTTFSPDKLPLLLYLTAGISFY